MDALLQSGLDISRRCVKLDHVGHSLKRAQSGTNNRPDSYEIWIREAVTDKERGPRDQHGRQVCGDYRILVQKLVVVSLGNDDVFFVPEVAMHLYDARC